MNNIEQQIMDYRPKEFPTMTFEDLGFFYGGLTGKKKDDFKDGNAKFISYKNIYSNPSLDINTEERVKISDDEKQNTVEYGDVLFTGSSETPDECAMTSVVTSHTKEKLYLNSFCFGWRLRDKDKLLPDFMKHLFRSHHYRKLFATTANGVTRYNVSKKTLGRLPVPLPPLEVQQEIVSILDTFTDMIDNLNEELELKQKQYEFYREDLLTLKEENVEKKRLGDVCETLSGYPFKSSLFADSGIKLMRGVNVKRGFFDFNAKDDRYWKSSEGLEKYLLKENDIIISMDGSLVGKSFAKLKKEHLPLLLVQRVAMVRAVKANQNYIYYCIRRDFANYVNSKKTPGAIPHVSMKDIEDFSILLPNTTRQKEIVSILDTFEESIQNIKEEIELRQKQYEYYREHLLNFD